MSASRNNILNKSKQLFEQHGYSKTTLTDIARSVGKVKSALYYYFSGKEEIFARIVKDEAEQFWNDLSASLEVGDGPEENLQAYISTRVHSMQKIARRYSFLKREIFELMPIIEENRRETDLLEKEKIAAILSRHPKYASSDKQLIKFKADMLVNTIKGLEIQMYVTDQVLIDDESLPVFRDVLLHGIL